MSASAKDSRSPRREYTTMPSVVPRATSGVIRTERGRSPRKACRRLSLMPSLSAGSSQDGTTTVRPVLSAREYEESGGSS